MQSALTMTETEWNACSDSARMLEFVRTRTSKRKLRLFAAACFRRLDRLLPDIRQLQAIEMLESTPADAGFQHGVVQRTRLALPSSANSFNGKCLDTDDPYFVGLMLYRELASSSTAHHATAAAGGVADCAGERMEQCRLLRCILGSRPFHEISVTPSWLTSRVCSIARSITRDGDFAKLHSLADALAEASCRDINILQHCRQTEPHVRGCWVLDLLLGLD